MKTIISVLLFLNSFYAISSPVDLTERLILRNELLLVTREVKDFLYNPEVKKRLSEWFANEDDPKYESELTYTHQCKSELRNYFPSENILLPLCYVLRQNDPSIRKLYIPLVKKHFLETKVALLEIMEDPKYDELENRSGIFFRAKALKYYLKLNPGMINNILSCFDSGLGDLIRNSSEWASNKKYDLPESTTILPFIFVNQCLRKYKTIDREKFLPINLAEEFSVPSKVNDLFSITHPGHALSETGWLSGNLISYFHYNDWSLPLEDLVARKQHLIDNYVLDPSADLLAYFLNQDHRDVFSSEHFDFNKHPVWSQQKGIFFQISKALGQAQKTIFIDVFFLGGSMGASLAKKLISVLDERPELKVYILKDNHNFFAYKKEMLPVFNFLLAYSIKHPNRMIVASSYVDGHYSGLPPAIAPLIARDQFSIDLGLRSHLLSKVSDGAGLYAAAKSDHSKVLVIDGNTPNPVAFVGSKNFTDSSGAICYDDVVKVQGPLAAVIQDDYYYDLFFALSLEMEKVYPNYVSTLANAIKTNSPLKTINQKVTAILRPIDLLNRNELHIPQISQKLNVKEFPHDMVARTGFNNVDSTRTSAIDQVVQMINFARNSIYIQDQFLFDQKVVAALILAKKQAQIEGRNLDILVLLEGLHDVIPRGMPNTVYLDLLKDAGIQVKSKITHPGLGISQEFHHKTISADGKYLIIGSANKDLITMYGAFREEQVEMANKDVVLAHDKVFLERWNSSLESEDFTLEDPLVDVASLLGKEYKPKELMLLIRNFLSFLFEV